MKQDDAEYSRLIVGHWTSKDGSAEYKPDGSGHASETSGDYDFHWWFAGGRMHVQMKGYEDVGPETSEVEFHGTDGMSLTTQSGTWEYTRD